MLKNAIDLDNTDNIPNKLLNHLVYDHTNVLVRKSPSKKGFHILTKGKRLCPVCSSFSDPNFVRIQEVGKPLILWTTKTYRNEIKNIQVRRKASEWLLLENFKYYQVIQDN